MSINTLIIKYTPREEKSRTREMLYDTYQYISGYTDISYLDLADDLPELMTRKKLMAYYKRNYLHEQLPPEVEQELSQMDRFARQVSYADVLIIACPVYNFGFPAPVKAWLDAALQRGRAYEVNEQGVVPLYTHLNVLVMYTAGIIYDDLHGTKDWNSIEPLVSANFQWVGAQDIQIIGIEGLDMLPSADVQARIHAAERRLHTICNKWYGI